MRKGFTMVELIFVIGILAFVITGLLIAYVNCVTLNEHNRNFSIAMNLARQLMELLYYNCYNRDMWELITEPAYGAGEGEPIPNLEGVTMPPGYSGTLYMDDKSPSLKEFTLVICWRERGTRVIGEDLNLNGVWDGEEEDFLVDNDRLDSPCMLTTALTEN